MSTAWISETRENQDRVTQQRERIAALTHGLAGVWFREFVTETESIVAELNRQYPEKFNRELRLVVSAVGFEL